MGNHYISSIMFPFIFQDSTWVRFLVSICSLDGPAIIESSMDGKRNLMASEIVCADQTRDWSWHGEFAHVQQDFSISVGSTRVFGCGQIATGSQSWLSASDHSNLPKINILICVKYMYSMIHLLTGMHIQVSTHCMHPQRCHDLINQVLLWWRVRRRCLMSTPVMPHP